MTNREQPVSTAMAPGLLRTLRVLGLWVGVIALMILLFGFGQAYKHELDYMDTAYDRCYDRDGREDVPCIEAVADMSGVEVAAPTLLVGGACLAVAIALVAASTVALLRRGLRRRDSHPAGLSG